MKITKENIDALNAVVKVDIVAEDFQPKVTKVLNDYRKKANVPGFRKGHVPMGMIKKQYGNSVKMDEVNKLLQESLNKFLADEKLDILGNPLPKINEEFSWDTDELSFEFELGLTPQFDIDLEGKHKIKDYEIVATEELLEKELENIQTRYGKVSDVEVAEEYSNVTGTFVNEEKGIENKTTFLVNDLKGKKNEKKVIGAKAGDVIELETKKLFSEDDKLQQVLGLSKEEAEDLDVKVTFTIEKVTFTEKAELDQELFDKLFADGSVKTVSELKEKIKDDAENQFKQQSEQNLLNAVIEHLIDDTKFDLPAEFLQKWLQSSGEKQLTEEEAKAEYEKSERGLRYQLIESKLIKDNDIKLDQAEFIDYTKGFVRTQMAQFGNTNPSDEELNGIVNRVLSNKEEAQRIQTQLISKKLLDFYKENMKFKTKEVTYDEFITEVYK